MPGARGKFARSTREVGRARKSARVARGDSPFIIHQLVFFQISPGRALAFLVFTETINKLPMPALWSVMFFFMLIMLGIDTEFGMLEGVVTPIMDMKIFPNVRKELLSGKMF